MTQRRRLRSLRRSIPEQVELCQSLETRALLTNIEVTAAFLVDGQGNQMDDAILGEQMGVRVRYTTDQIATTQHRIEFKVDGVIRDVTTTHGTGGAGTWSWIRSGWYATAGTHQVEVFVDADNQIAEDDETDNKFSFTVSTVSGTPSFKLQWPLEGSIQQDNYITNFHDVDLSSGISDYRGGPYAYDGHSAWDIGPGHFSDMDEGVDVYAAAAGTVTEIHDGEFDRQTDGFDLNPEPTANYVRIDHGDGYETFYWHLRRDSVQVQVGQTVVAGDLLGLMGSSGVSTGTHVHFGLRRHGRGIESMMDPGTYLAVNIPYSDDVTILRSSGVWSEPPTNYLKEQAPRTNVFNNSSPIPHVWAYFTALNKDDVIAYTWKRPDGSTFTTTQVTASADFRTGWWWFSRNLGANAMIGTWTIDFSVNGTKLGEDKFDVTANGAPELNVFQGSDSVRHNRFTPIDFGTATLNGTEPQITFSLRNTGSDVLNPGNVTAPEGFAVVQGPPATLAVGASANLVIKRLTNATGYAAGEVTIASDDFDEPMYRFSVEGLVETSEEKLLLGIGVRSVDEGTRTIANVRRTGPTTETLTVNLSASLHPSQLSFPSSVVIPAGEDYVSFWVEAVNDTAAEADQFVRLSAAATGLSPAFNHLFVIDNDVGFVLAETDGSTIVNESGDTDTVQIYLTDQPTADVVFLVTSADQTEVRVQTSTVRFTPANWSIPQTVTLVGFNDNEIDGNQTVNVVFAVSSSADNRYANLASQPVSVTNVDNDAAGFSVVESTDTVVEEAGATDSFQVVLDVAPASDVVITVMSADESEVTVDLPSLLFTVSNWNIPQTVVVSAVDDELLDGDRQTTITVAVDSAASDPEFASLGSKFVVATSKDNEFVSFSVTESNGTSVTEAGGTDSFEVVLNSPPSTNVVFDLTPNGTTQAAIDKSTLTFTPSNWNVPQVVTVSGIDDTVTDGDQETVIAISVNADASDDAYDSVEDQSVVVTSIDDESTVFTINDVTVDEADGTATFAVSLSTPLDIDVQVDLAFVSGTATNADFDTTPTILTFAAGSSTVQTIEVPIVEDDLVELEEAFTAMLAINSATALGNRSVDVSDMATGVITDNDIATFTIDDVTVNENAGTATFSVSVSKPIDTAVAVDVMYSANTATASDFDATTDRLSFPAGSAATRTATVVITNDNLVELNESFMASLILDTSALGTRNVEFSDTAIGTIISEDTAAFTIGDVRVNEDEGTATFSVTTSRPVDVDVAIDVIFTDGTSSAADSDANSSTVMFLAGSTVSQVVEVSIFEDEIAEPTEFFNAALLISDSTPIGDRAIDVSDTGIGVINDNDTAVFTIEDITANEADLTATFTVSLSNPLDIVFLVDVNFVPDTASLADFDATTLTVTFPAGSTQAQAVTVPIADDMVELTEQFLAALAIAESNRVGTRKVVASDSAVATIIDDDVATFTIEDITANEAEGSAEFVISLSNPVDVTTTIDVTFSTGTAEDVDFDTTAASVTFPAASVTPQTVFVTITDDDFVEPDETFTALLSIRESVDGRNLDVTDTATATIVSDDFPVSGNVDGDTDFDANDTFLIHLVKLSGTDLQIDQSKGSSPETAEQIRSTIGELSFAADVDGDSDFDANDSFLMHLVKLSGTDLQIDQSKGSSSLTALEIRERVNNLDTPSTSSVSSMMQRPSQRGGYQFSNALESQRTHDLFAANEFSDEKTCVPVAQWAEFETTTEQEQFWDEFRTWIDLL